MKLTNRIHEILYLVALLVFAVVLTTALVMAAERSSESSKKSVSQVNGFEAPRLIESGPMGCV